MKNSISRICVVGLYGNRTIDANITDNTLILVGENGSGKTTFLRILFHFLSGRWFSLRQFQFERIIAVIGGVEFSIAHETLVKGYERVDRRLLHTVPPSVRHRLLDWASISSRSPQDMPPEIEHWFARTGLPWDTFVRQMELFGDNPKGPQKELQETIQRVRAVVDAQVLYLPTYRRIERELGSIFEGVDSDDLKKSKMRSQTPDAQDAYIELVEFGMKDVQQAIERSLVSLKDFARENLTSLTLRYLGDVVDQEYLNVGMRELAAVSEDTIHSVLDRIHESIFTPLHKERLLKLINVARGTQSPDEHSKIISHYFLKLLHFQELLKEREMPISAFCELCSKYIVDKQFVYDSANFGFTIKPRDEKQTKREIELSDLSSGEKQIVSLFSHLYLSGKSSYFVLIDEPELSLSVPWQRRFLPDIKRGGFCSGLVAVTHSPFIYDNDLRSYAHALGEFVVPARNIWQ